MGLYVTLCLLCGAVVTLAAENELCKEVIAAAGSASEALARVFVEEEIRDNSICAFRSDELFWKEGGVKAGPRAVIRRILAQKCPETENSAMCPRTAADLLMSRLAASLAAVDTPAEKQKRTAVAERRELQTNDLATNLQGTSVWVKGGGKIALGDDADASLSWHSAGPSRFCRTLLLYERVRVHQL